MPLVEVTVSVSLSDDQVAAIQSELIVKLAEASGKAPQKFMVNVRHSAKLFFGGTADAAGYVQMAGISGFTQEFNDAATAIFGSVIEPFGIPTARLFVTYTQREKTHWALNGKTYASQ